MKWELLITFLVAGVGAEVFWWFSLPLPFLLGPLAACLVAALLRVPMRGPGQFGVLMRTILGVAVGATITPELIGTLPKIALSVALVPVFVAVIGLIGYPFFRKICRFDPATAFYAAMPGGFQDMLVFGEEAGGNVRRLSLIHATRLLVIVTLVPVLLINFYGLTLDKPPGQPAHSIPVHEMLLMLAAAIIGWKGGQAIGLFGAAILGPMIVTAIFSLSGLIHVRPPAEAIVMAQFFIGMSVGIHYVGVTMAELRNDVLAGTVFCVILALIALAFAEIVKQAGLAPGLEAFLAFAPGGQAEMTVLSIIVGADLAFVVTHHVVRLLVVITGAPIVSIIAMKGSGKKS